MVFRVTCVLSLLSLLAGVGRAQSACVDLAITEVVYEGVEGLNRKDKVRVHITQSPHCLRPLKVRAEVSLLSAAVTCPSASSVTTVLLAGPVPTWR